MKEDKVTIAESYLYTHVGSTVFKAIEDIPYGKELILEAMITFKDDHDKVVSTPNELSKRKKR